jgi:ferredoxin
MMDETVRLLEGLGVPRDRIHTESFESGAGAEVGIEADEPMPTAGVPAPGSNGHTRGSADVVELTFRRTGRTVRVGRETTVLEAAESVGVDIPSDCLAGVCGTCRTRVVSGEVEMEYAEALTAAERGRGVILACQAQCVGDVVVEA